MKTRILFTIIFLSVWVPRLGAQETVTDTLEFGRATADSPARMLQGQVSGVRISSVDGSPAGIVNTNIRGLNSVRGLSEPLWIVDGAILSSTVAEEMPAFWNYGEWGYMSPVSPLGTVNPYDIESIEVLKNTSATAIYGSRGANGVIIITTKKAQKDTPFSLKWNSNAGVNVPVQTSQYLKPSVIHTHSLNLDHSTGRTKFHLSAWFRQNQGVVARTGRMNGGLKMGLETKTNKYIWFGMNAAVSVDGLDSQPGTAWYGAPSTMLAIRGIDPLNQLDKTDVDGFLKDFDDNTRVFRTTDNAFLTINFAPWLRWHTTIGVDLQSVSRYLWAGNGTALGYWNNGVAGLSYQSKLRFDANSELKFDRYFAKDHHFTLSAAFNAYGDLNKFNTMAGDSFSSHSLRAKGIQLLGSAAIIRKFSPDLLHYGGYGHLTYDYKDIFGLDGVIRIESTPKYDSNPVYYPSASGYFDIANLAFAGSRAVSTLRLEGGYGKAGFEREMPYLMFNRYSGGLYPKVDDSVTSFYEGFNRMNSTEWNVALKLGFLNDRITLKAAWYDKSTLDRLYLNRFGGIGSAVSGLWVVKPRTEVSRQESTIANRGVEFDINAEIFKTNNVSWTVYANGAYNINRLMKVGENDVKGLALNPDGLTVTRNEVGQSVSSLYGYRLDSDKVVTDKGILGNTLPKFHGSFGTAVRCKNLTFELLFNGACGFSILNMNRMLAAGIDGDLAASNYVESGDFLRLGRAAVSYNIPLKAKWIQGLKLNLSADNLLTFTKYSGWNPDVNSFGITNLAYGIDCGSSPAVRTVVFGICANF